MSKEEQNQILNIMAVNTIRFAKANDTEISPQKLFQMVWDILFDKLYLNGAYASNQNINNMVFGSFQLNIREFLLFKIISIFKQNHINYSPLVLTNNHDAVDEIKQSKQSSLLVSTHNGFTHNFKLFEDLDREISTIGIQPYVNQTMDRSGINKKINVIKKDKFSLAYLKKVIPNGDLISSTVDYSENKGLFEYINPNLFQFAVTNKLPLYFTKPEVLDTGEVNVFIQAAPSKENAMVNANAYIEFYNSVGNHRRLLVLGS